MFKSLVIDGKKFMSDGVTYDDKATMAKNIERYRKDGFETTSSEEGGKFYMYSRKVVTDFTVEGGGP